MIAASPCLRGTRSGVLIAFIAALAWLPLLARSALLLLALRIVLLVGLPALRHAGGLLAAGLWAAGLLMTAAMALILLRMLLIGLLTWLHLLAPRLLLRLL
jgi:hypothetical protein